MQELKINSKFGIGEKVITIWNRSVEFTCPICKGEGSFVHNGYKVRCTHCYGAGKLHTEEKIWQVDTEPMEVTGIKISISENGKQNISYNLHNANRQCRKRIERNTFATVEEAQSYCDVLNTEIKSKVEEEIRVIHAKYDAIKEEEEDC